MVSTLRFSISIAALTLLLASTACSEDRRRGPDVDSGTVRVDGGSGGDGGGIDGGGGTDGGGTDGGADICGFVGDLARTCTLDSECDFGLHQTDCCGNQLAYGFLASEATTFETQETACRESLPACDCPAGPIQTQQGSEALEEASIGVRCDMGACWTYVAE